MIGNIALSEDILQKVSELAAKDQVSMEEFVSAAVSEHLAGREYLQRRAKRANREGFQAALDQIPDVEPDGADRL
jgi:hypothetical protein